MKRSIIILLLIGSAKLMLAQSAKEILTKTLEEMGGVELWKQMEFIKMKTAGHKYWLEQSENPNGPYLTTYEMVEEIRGINSLKLHRKETNHHFQAKNGQNTEVMLNGENGTIFFGQRSMPIPYQFRSGYDEWLRYAPEHHLLKALEGKSKFDGITDLEGTSHFVISYMENRLKHKLFINTNNYLLGKIEFESFQPTDIFNFPWGKFVNEVRYSLQWLYPGNIRYPAQWSIGKLGKPFRSITILDIDFNPAIDPTLFTLSDDYKSPPEPVFVNDIPLDTNGIIEVAPGIYTIPGMWYVGHIVQSDGIFIIEGPISSGYNEQHLEFVRSKYPDKPIKGVFSTSDSWPHLGGIRPFAALNLPIYTNYLNRKLIDMVLSSDHSLSPDRYQKSPISADFRLVKKELFVDDSDNPLRILPINGEGGERMIALYFPKQKVLYASDLVQKTRNGKFFAPQYLSEVKAMVDRYHLDVQTVFAMHTSPLPWQDVIDALNKE